MPVRQAKAYVRAELFREFTLNEESVSFCVDLAVLLQCLQIFGESSHVELSYGGLGHPFCVL